MRCAVAPLKASSASAHRALSGCSTRASCARDARRASAPAADTPSSGNAAPGAHLLVARFHFSGHGAQRQPQHRMRSGARGALRQHIARKVRRIVRERVTWHNTCSTWGYRQAPMVRSSSGASNAGRARRRQRARALLRKQTRQTAHYPIPAGAPGRRRESSLRRTRVMDAACLMDSRWSEERRGARRALSMLSALRELSVEV